MSGRTISALGQKRTFAVQKVMSALPPKADIAAISSAGQLAAFPLRIERSLRDYEGVSLP